MHVESETTTERVAAFQTREIHNLKSLASSLLEPGDAVTSVAQNCISPRVLQMAREFPQGTVDEASLREAFAADLNLMVDGPLLYENERLSESELPDPVRSMLDSGPRDEETVRRLNIDFVERAFGRHIQVEPYPGAQAFQSGDAFRFFGRRREGTEIVSRVIAHETVLVYAPSGAGKTSLLNARVIPLLREKQCDVLPPMRVQGPDESYARKARNPYMVHALARCWSEDPIAQRAVAREELPSLTLAEFLARRESAAPPEPIPRPLVAIFDQFEELFTFYPQYWEKRADVFRQMSEALEQNHLLRILLLMREDFIAELEPHTKVFRTGLRLQIRLERLREEAALRAIVGPIERTKRRYAEGVAKALVTEKLLAIKDPEGGEMRAEFVEPVQLQVVCRKLWHDLPPDALEITREHMDRLADVSAALQVYYEQCVAEATAAFELKEGRLRTWFEKHLITAAGTRSLLFMDEETAGDLPNDVVRFLERMYIIRAEPRGHKRWYELSHDRLVPAVLDSNRAYRAQVGAGAEERYRPIVAQAEQWDAAGRTAEALLEPDDLAEAEHYLAILDAQGLEPSELFAEYVEESREAQQQKRLREAQEKVQLQAELLDTQRAKNKFFRLALGLAAMLLLFATASAIWILIAHFQSEHRLSSSLISDGMLEVARNDIAPAELLFVEAGEHEWWPPRGDRIRRDLYWSRLHGLETLLVKPDVDSLEAGHDGRFALLVHSQSHPKEPGRLRLYRLPDPGSQRSFAQQGLVPVDIPLPSEANRGIRWQEAGTRFVVVSDARPPADPSGNDAENSQIAQVFDAETRTAVAPPLRHADGSRVRLFDLSEDGAWLVTSGEAGIYAWDLETLSKRPSGDPVVQEPAFKLTEISSASDSGGAPSEDRDGTVTTLRVWSPTKTLGSRSAGPLVFCARRMPVPQSSEMRTMCWLLRPGNSGSNGDPGQPPEAWKESVVWETADDGGEVPADVTVTAADFSSDGRCVAAGCSDGTVRMWLVDNLWENSLDTETPRYHWDVRHPGPISKLVFSPDGQRLAAVAGDNSAFVWNIADPTTSAPLQHSAQIFDLDFSPDGVLIATASRDRSVRVWRPDYENLPLVELVGSPIFHVGSIARVRFLAGGQRLFTATFESGGCSGYGAIWRLSDQELLPDSYTVEGLLGTPGIALEHAGEVPALVGVAMPPPDDATAPTSHDSENTDASGESHGRVPEEGPQRMPAVADFHHLRLPSRYAAGSLISLSKSGRHVIAVTKDGSVTVFDVQKAEVVAEWKPAADRVQRPNRERQGRHAPESQPAITQAGCHSERRLAALATQHDDSATLGFWRWDASGSAPAGGKVVRVWEKPLAELTGASESIASLDFLTFSPDGRFAALAATLGPRSKGCCFVFRIEEASGGQGWTVTPCGKVEHEESITCVDFNHDCTRIATASRYDVAKIHELENGSVQPSADGELTLAHTADVTLVRFFARKSDGKQFVVTCSEDNTARVWDAETGEPATRELPHAGGVRHAAVDSSGELLVTASTVFASIWELGTGRKVAFLRTVAPVQHVGFGNGGHSILAVSSHDPLFASRFRAGGEARDGAAPPLLAATIRRWDLPRDKGSAAAALNQAAQQEGAYLSLLAAGEFDEEHSSLKRLDLDRLRELWDSVKKHWTDQDRGEVLPESVSHKEHTQHWEARGEPFAAWWHARQDGGAEEERVAQLRQAAEGERDLTLTSLLEAKRRESKARQEQVLGELRVQQAQLARQQKDEGRDGEQQKLTEKVEYLEKQLAVLNEMLDSYKKREQYLSGELKQQQESRRSQKAYYAPNYLPAIPKK